MKRLKIILFTCIIFATISPSTIVQASNINKNKTEIVKTGWQPINGHWYYLNKNGIKQTGWQPINGHWYYLDRNGAMLTGWQSIEGNWYYLDKNGCMLQGWQLLNGSWFYLEPNGAMAIGWKQVYKSWYYLNPKNGAMLTGWQTINGKKYYLNENGAMLMGWQTINGKKYYFENSGQLNSSKEFKDNKSGVSNEQLSMAQKILQEARKHIGKSYEWGATGPETFDCSGFTKYVFSKFNYNIGRTTYNQINAGRAVRYSDLMPADLVFCGGSYSSPRHVGIYVGGGKMIHSPRTGQTVKISNVYDFVAARRVLKNN